MSNTTDKNSKMLSFYAINQYVEDNIILPTETMMRGRDVVQWGEGNAYPDYLLDLYNNVPTLKSIINGCVDFVVGNDVVTSHNLQGDVMNKAGDTIRDLVKRMAFDYFVYGGFSLQMIEAQDGTLAELYNTEIRHLRTNKRNDVFFYSENWGAKYGRTNKAIQYPKFLQGVHQPSSILYVKNVHTQTYPSPIYGASVKACEIEKCIDDFHLNAINNGFVSSYIVNFNNGNPTDEIKEEIERSYNEKFAGHQNAGRIVFSWNRDAESKTTIEKVDVEDFGEKYKSLADHSRQQIFTAFRANPNLFGIPTENLGFSSEEYESAFRLFNRTQIQPVQALIVDAFDKVFGEKDSIRIIPFSMDAINKEEE